MAKDGTFTRDDYRAFSDPCKFVDAGVDGKRAREVLTLTHLRELERGDLDDLLARVPFLLTQMAAGAPRRTATMSVCPRRFTAPFRCAQRRLPFARRRPPCPLVRADADGARREVVRMTRSNSGGKTALAPVKNGAGNILLRR